MGDAVIDKVRSHPVLSEFCDPLPPLGSADAEVAGTVRRFGELLGSRDKQLSVSLRLPEQHLGLRVGPQGAEVGDADAEPPDLEIITSGETWRSIAAGTLAPLAAMINGQLRFRGNVLLASEVVRQLRAAASTEKEQ